MNWLLHYSALAVLPTTILIHLLYAPYTKVEESFNIQAIHDILTYGIPINDPAARLSSHYDHFDFPGAVPRTFVGALAVSGVSWPIVECVRDPEITQAIVRAVVGLFNAAALLCFQDAVSQSFGRVAGYWYIFLQSSQFHVMYYASRTLPNVYAFGLCTIALRYLAFSNFGPLTRRSNRQKLSLYLLTITGVIFRSELALFLSTHVLWLYFIRRVSLRTVIIPAGITALAVGLLITVSIDSFFWQQFPLWPEWEAFRYNTIEGRSSDWGTSPWHFYFSSSLPKLMLNPLSLFLCVPVALANRLIRRFSTDMLAPLAAFIAFYSFLPHKEWRFILYVVPSFTAVASAGAATISSRRHKSWTYKLLTQALVSSIILSFAVSAGQLYISSLNYPGAVALNRLHELAHGERPLIRVHLDNLACQTGVTRFLQKPTPGLSNDWAEQTVWHYDKTEDEARLLDPFFWERFDYVIAEGPERVIGKWEIIEEVEGFAGVMLSQSQSRDEGKWRMSGKMARLVGSKRAEWLIQMEEVLQSLEMWLRKNVTKGWWVQVRMEPKLKIMRKQDLL